MASMSLVTLRKIFDLETNFGSTCKLRTAQNKKGNPTSENVV